MNAVPHPARTTTILAALCPLLLLAPVRSFAGGNEYYLAFADSPAGSSLRVEIAADVPASGTVTVAGIAFSQPFSLAAGGQVIIALPESAKAVGEVAGAQLGVHVLADTTVTVNAFSTGTGSTNDYLALPVEDLGTEYRIVSSIADHVSGFPSEFVVIGTTASTLVTITPSFATDSGHPAGVPFQQSLGAGEVLQVQASAAGADLTGTLVTATGPVAVVSGHYLGPIPDLGQTYYDHMAVMLPPVPAWGLEYIVGPTVGRTSGDYFVLVAAENGTAVTGSAFGSGFLDAGQTLSFTGGQTVSVTADKPVLLAQYFQSSSVDGVTDADPALMIVPPRERLATSHRFSVPQLSGGTHYANLIIATADTGSVTLDGGYLPPGTFFGTSGGNAFGWTAMTEGSHVITGPSPLSVRVYGFAPGTSYGFYTRADSSAAPPPPPVTAPVITSIRDVPNDQGRQLRIVWNASPQDTAGSAVPIVQYSIYRRYDPGLAKAQWDHVGDVPAYVQESYAAVVPSLADSTAAGGIYYSTYFVRAGTASPAVFFDSAPDSGYSVDNLAPSAPLNLLYGGGVLSWDPSPATDFNYFTVYGAGTNDLGTAAVVAYSVEPSLDVSGSPYPYYFVTATDFSGNEGPAAQLSVASGVGDAPRPRALALSSCPNPFNPSTTISYAVPRAGLVTVGIYDVAGRLVKQLVKAEPREAGLFRVEWDGRSETGAAAASGVYLVRIASGDEARSLKVTLSK